jgi:hypothetical protein
MAASVEALAHVTPHSFCLCPSLVLPCGASMVWGAPSSRTNKLPFQWQVPPGQLACYTSNFPLIHRI